MLKFLDDILNRVTMYRLVVYELLALLGAALVYAFFGLLSFDPLSLAFSTAFIFVVSWSANRLFAYFFDASYNPESAWITALILALLIAPPSGFADVAYYTIAFWASAWAIASKYIFAWNRKHLFNPAAAGIAVTALTLGASATWWVGMPLMLPFVLAGGLLIVRKIHRFDLWWAFMLVYAAGILYPALNYGKDIVTVFSQSFLNAPTVFFATVMLTEPMTTPPTRWLRILYGALVAFLFLPNTSIFGFFLTPELALLAGNIFAYAVSPKYKLVLTLVDRIRLSPDVYEFVFEPERAFRFKAGQYLEWTLPHQNADSRSVRRYFTIASSPEDRYVRLGVKFYDPPSTFKRKLLSMRRGDTVVAAQLAGDFTLPHDTGKKLVFIAGGIGITPFRSQLQHLLDTKEKRPITVLYANKTPQDAVYSELLTEAKTELGIETVYAFTDTDTPLPTGAVRALDPRTIAAKVPDFRERMFYLSGPQGMVTAFREHLLAMGVHRRNIRTDYFPGFA